MNAVLQALAHAPELCFAIESSPHHSTCPIAIRNFIEGKESKEVVEPTTEKKAEITPPYASKKKIQITVHKQQKGLTLYWK